MSRGMSWYTNPANPVGLYSGYDGGRNTAVKFVDKPWDSRDTVVTSWLVAIVLSLVLIIVVCANRGR